MLDVLSVIRNRWEPLVILSAEGELSQRLVRKGFAVQRIPMPALRPWNAFQAINGACKRWMAEIIYASGTRAALYGGMVARYLRKPLIWHCRVAKKDRIADRLLVHLSTKIIANSRATAARFFGKARNKVAVIHNGIDLDWLQNGTIANAEMIRQDWKVILTVGRVSPWKRHDLILSAFEKVAETDSALHLVCVGDRDRHEDDWWKVLQQRTRRSRHSDRIHWTGQVDDVRPWYKAASILVHASDHEPFGRVLVEAMAVGLPVVATSGGGVPEIIRHGKEGLLVPPGSADSIAQSLETAMSDEQLRRRLAAAGRLRSAHFDRRRLAAGMLALLDEVAAGHRITTGLAPDEKR